MTGVGGIWVFQFFSITKPSVLLHLLESQHLTARWSWRDYIQTSHSHFEYHHWMHILTFHSSLRKIEENWRWQSNKHVMEMRCQVCLGWLPLDLQSANVSVGFENSAKKSWSTRLRGWERFLKHVTGFLGCRYLKCETSVLTFLMISRNVFKWSF